MQRARARLQIAAYLHRYAAYAIITDRNRISFCFLARAGRRATWHAIDEGATPEEDQCASVGVTTNYCSLSRPCERVRKRLLPRSTVCVSRSPLSAAK